MSEEIQIVEEKINIEANNSFGYTKTRWEDLLGSPSDNPDYLLSNLNDVDVSGIDDNKILKYNSTSGKWEMADDTGGTSAVWGNITGTLSDQLDLQSELDLKLDISAFIPAGSDKELQYNDNGSFGGTSNATIESEGLQISFGSKLLFSDAKLYELIPGFLFLEVGGSSIMSITSTGFGIASSSGAQFLNEVPSATNPTIIPRQSDFTSGIGSSANGILSHIAGGVEGIRLTSTQVIMANLPTSDPSIANALWVDSSAGYVVKQSQG